VNGRRAEIQHHHRAHGLTLIDLVMVLLIVGITVAIAAPRYTQGMTRYRADAAARRLVADLEWARTEAIARSGSIEVVFDFTGHTYSLKTVESINRNSVDNQVSLQKEPYQATLVSAFGDSVAGTALIFDGYGTADRNGQIVIQVGDEQRIVTVNGQTGRSSVLP